MAKPGKLPDFRKMYPEASEEVIEVLRETERKMGSIITCMCLVIYNALICVPVLEFQEYFLIFKD